jgi:hypothetical protein
MKNCFNSTTCWKSALRSQAVLPGYNDISFYDTPSITSDILWYQFLTVNRNIILPAYNDTRL